LSDSPSSILRCSGCGLQLAPTLLACPKCNRLTHTSRLEELASQARSAEAANNVSTALALWREALELLPRDSKQFKLVSLQINQLGERLPNSVPPHSAPLFPSTNPRPDTSSAKGTQKGKTTTAGIAAGIGAVGLFVWKFKVLFAGLTKTTTLFSMLASLGVYWTLWGWKFALGIVLSIYIHEMGHIIQLRRYGFRTGVPTFIPGLGALIRMQQQVVNPREDADIGLAGPVYGLGAAVFSLVVWQLTGLPIFAAIAGVGAWINLFNLLPFGSLDGGRSFHAMSRIQKTAAATCVAAAWYFSGDGMLVLVFLGCVVQLFAPSASSPGYVKGTCIYCLLVLILSAIAMVRTQAEEKVEPKPSVVALYRGELLRS
jgi:Zn-dependent protease